MMNTKLSKREFYTQTDTRKYKLEWIGFWTATILSAFYIIITPWAIVALPSCVICGIFLKKTMDKRWGVVLMVMGVISFIMIGIGLGGQGVVMIVSGWWFYRVLGNLDKAYAQYLETGVIPDLKGQ